MSKVRLADAHDWLFGGLVSKVHPQLMLMMLGCFGGVMSEVRPADAHDAGCLGVLCPKYAQLMLMMLAAWGFCVQSMTS